MKKYLSVIIAAVAFIFPLVYFVYCIRSSRLIDSSFVIKPLIAAVIAVLFSLIKRIPDGIRIAVSSLAFVFSLGLFSLAMMYQPAEFLVKTGDEAIRDADRPLIECAGGYESARMYDIIGSDGSSGRVQLIKFKEESFPEVIKYIEENYEPYEGDVGEYDSKTGISLDGFSFRLNGASVIPYYASLTGINAETREIAVVSYGWPSGGISEIDEDFINYQCGRRFVKPYEKGGYPALYWYCLTAN